MSTFAAFLLDNSYEVNGNEQELKLREKEPFLLAKEETIELAFKAGRDSRDKSYFTSHRILLKDGKGIGHKRKNFTSYSYNSIDGFSITTSGGWLDDDVEIHLYCVDGYVIELELAKNHVNLFALQQFISTKVLRRGDEDGKETKQQQQHDTISVTKAGTLSSFTSFFTRDATSYDPQKMQERFTIETPILMVNETITLAFQTGRDFLIFTSDRMIVMDVQGILGKRICFETVLWNTIRAVEIATSSGILDRDMELTLHLNRTDKPTMTIDFRKGSTNIFDVKKCITNHILGPDIDTKETPPMDASTGSNWSLGSFLDRDANRPVNTNKMNTMLHSKQTPILQQSEIVEMAFQGIRDMVIFTTKRIVLIDPTGIRGKKIIYTSIPYTSILLFAIETAGTVVDLDTEVMIWTDLIPIPRNPDDAEDDDETGKEKERQPGLSFLELDFNKKLVNIIALKKYLSFRCLNANASNSKNNNIMSNDDGISPSVAIAEVKTSVMGNLASYFSDNQRAIDPKGVNKQLHTDTPILLDDETVIMAFKSGRDLTIFTNLRIMILDVQGITGKRVSYRSLPYTCVRAFSVESAGSWDLDSELDIYTGNLWNMGKIEMDFRKGQVDILSIHKFLSAMILDDPEEGLKYIESAGASAEVSKVGFSGFMSWLGNNSVEQDATTMDEMFHSDPPLLMASEHCEKAYKTGRDMFIYTTHRVILVDVQGLRGKKVEYLSIPHSSIKGFEVETAGHMDRDAEVYLKIDIPAKPKIQQDILVKRGDVMEVQLHLTNKLVME